MDLTVREGYKIIALQEVENTLAKKVHDNADVATEIESVSKMYATVSVFLVVCLERGKYAKFNPRRISVLLNRSNNFDSNGFVSPLIFGLDDFTKSALPE